MAYKCCLRIAKTIILYFQTVLVSKLQIMVRWNEFLYMVDSVSSGTEMQIESQCY